MRIGFLTDIHNADPALVDITLDVLKHLGAEAFVLNGDIADLASTVHESQERVARVLEVAGKKGLRTYVNTGSHESVDSFETPMAVLGNRYGNLVNSRDEPVVTVDGHDLIFLPGSFTLTGNSGYRLGSEIPTGEYLFFGEVCMPFREDVMQEKLSRGEDFVRAHYQNINDLERHVRNPSKAVVVCHEPPRFNNKESGIDYSHFATDGRGIVPIVALAGELRRRNIPVNDRNIQRLAGQAGLTVKKENCGNLGFRQLLDRLGVRKGVFGHFHGGSHKAHTFSGTPVDEAKYVNDLFWNSGCVSSLMCGLYHVSNEGVGYQNVNIRDHVEIG